MNERLNKALSNPLWVSHEKGDWYIMDGKPDLWIIVYYPLFQNGKTQEYYKEPRALMQSIERKGFWSKEVPLRYLTRY